MKKKIFPNGVLNSGLASLVKGVVRNATGYSALCTVKDITIGAVGAVIERTENKSLKNIKSKVCGEGNSDWWDYLGIAIGITVFLYTAYQVFTGEISISEFQKLNK